MTRQNDRNTRFRVAHLNPRQATEFKIAPNAEAKAELAKQLNLLALPELHFSGRLTASGSDDWRLSGKLTATVVQACVVTLEPVKTSISEHVSRVYSPHITPPEEDEVEIPEDDIEPLGQYIDAAEVMAEALALALPLYPRAEGAQLDAPKADETTDEDSARRPFAGLADLLKKNDGA